MQKQIIMNLLVIALLMCFVALNCVAIQKTSIAQKLEVEKDTLSDYQILTDSTVKNVFGDACSKSGMPPKGKQSIDNLVRKRDYSTIKSILNGFNNEGKIYAIEALLTLNANNEIELTDNDKNKIKSIIEKNILIVRCQGCLYSTIRSIELFNEADFKRLLKKNKIEITRMHK